MRITDAKIINALKAGKRITSNGMPSHCFLQADVDCDGILSLCTLGTSSVVKGVVKSIKKAGEELDD